MSKIIVEAGQLIASNTDILNSSLLQTVPSNGWLSFETQASDADQTNSMSISIQLPDGSNPVNGALVPGTATAGLAGILDELLSFKLRFRVAQGGHCVFSCVETGAALLTYRVIFTPFR